MSRGNSWCKCLDPTRFFFRRVEDSPRGNDWEENNLLLGDLVDADDDVNPLSDTQIRILLDEKFARREVISDAGSDKTQWEDTTDANESNEEDMCRVRIRSSPRGSPRENGSKGSPVQDGEVVAGKMGKTSRESNRASNSTSMYGSARSSSTSTMSMTELRDSGSSASSSSSTPVASTSGGVFNDRGSRENLNHSNLSTESSPPVEHYHIGSPDISSAVSGNLPGVTGGNVVGELAKRKNVVPGFLDEEEEKVLPGFLDNKSNRENINNNMNNNRGGGGGQENRENSNFYSSYNKDDRGERDLAETYSTL